MFTIWALFLHYLAITSGKYVERTIYTKWYLSICVMIDVKTSLYSNTAEKIVALNVWSALGFFCYPFPPLFIGNTFMLVLLYHGLAS